MVQNDERSLNRGFRLGNWDVHPALNRIESDGLSEQLEPLVMDVLVCLAERPGDVVSRGEILDTVWSDAVIGEEGLTRRISTLRKILGDDREHPRFIETIRKGGYRLIAPVAPLPDAEPPRAAPPPAPLRRSRRLGLASVGLLCALLVVWRLVPSGEPESALAVALDEARPLTSHPGRELQPAVSPDGTRVAYARIPADRGRYAVFVQQVGSETPIQLTNGPGHQLHPVWSPDGSRVAYVQTVGGVSTVRSVASLGGNHRLEWAPETALHGLAWLRDGSFVACRADTALGSVPLYRYDASSGLQTRLTRPERRHGGDYTPRLHPFDDRLAFIRDDGNGYRDVHTVDLVSGETRRVTRQRSEMHGVAWWPDGGTIVFGSKLRGRYELWSVDAIDGEGAPLPGRTGALAPAVAGHAEVLAFEEMRRVVDIVRIDARDGAVTPLIRSTGQDLSPAPSPDGSQIAFRSDRSGFLEIWVCNADGSDPRQLTRLEGADVRAPYWSPDGLTLAFGARREGYQAVGLITVSTDERNWIGGDGHHDRLHGWLDDETLAVASDRDGAWRLWSLHAGDGAVAPLCADASLLLGALDDGSLLVMRTNDPAVWRLDESGTLTMEVDAETIRTCRGLAVADGELLLVRATADGGRLERPDGAPVCVLPSDVVGWIAGETGGAAYLGELVRERHSDLFVLEPER